MLTEWAEVRLQTISFFLLALLGVAAGVRWLWNGLLPDLPRLPRLTYGRSLGIVALWGLLFLVVLTMVATAREMMVPGVWAGKGLLYRIPSAPPEKEDPLRMEDRREHLRRLKGAIWHYAARHGGRFPASDREPEVDPALWEVPGTCGIRYRYLPNRVPSGPAAILAYEPAVYGDLQMTLRSDGRIEPIPSAELRRELTPTQPETRP